MTPKKSNRLKVAVGRRQRPNLTVLIRKLLWAELHQLKAVFDAPLLRLLPADAYEEERKEGLFGIIWLWAQVGEN